MVYFMETTRKICCDEHEEWLSVARDSGRLGLVEIASSEELNRVILLPPRMALVLAEAIRALAMEMILGSEEDQ